METLSEWQNELSERRQKHLEGPENTGQAQQQQKTQRNVEDD